jgi:hypothetical protein
MNHDDVAAGLPIDFESVAAKNRNQLAAGELTELLRQTETLTLCVETSAGIGSPRCSRLSMWRRIASVINALASSSEVPSV